MSAGSIGDSVLAVAKGVMLACAISVAAAIVVIALGMLGVIPKGWLHHYSAEPDLMVIALAVGIVAKAAGGWLAARVAPSVPWLHAAFVGLAMALIGVGTSLLMTERMSTYDIAGAAVAVPAALAGGLLARARVAS